MTDTLASIVIIGIIGIIVYVSYMSGRSTSFKKQNMLCEYTQFLFFHPQVYNDHRVKFCAYLESIKNRDVVSKAMYFYQAIEGMAIQLRGEIVLANTIKREKPEDM